MTSHESRVTTYIKKDGGGSCRRGVACGASLSTRLPTPPTLVSHVAARQSLSIQNKSALYVNRALTHEPPRPSQ